MVTFENMAAVLAIITFFIIDIGGLLLCNKLDLLTSSKKHVNEAIKRGNVVKAYYVPGSSSVEEMENSSGNKYDRYCSSYKYVIDGKEYIKKGIVSVGVPRETITLYYLDDYSKAFLYNEVVDKKFIRNIIPIVLFVTGLVMAAKVYSFFIGG